MTFATLLRRRMVVRSLLLLFWALVAAALSVPAFAQVGSDRYSSLVMDARSGEVISSVAPDEPRYPASLTKVMTIYMLFEALRDRRVTLDQLVPVSPHAASMSPSKLGLVPGSVLTVEQALLGLVTKSANDAAAALGELLGGDEDRFAEMMTARARALGMTRTTFRNASGLPDWDQITTARDLATLVRHMVQDFPVQYRYFSVPSFVFHGRVIPNHDTMLQTYAGADGLKTGWIEASGHNLLTSALRGDTRLIGVVLGAGSLGQRNLAMTSILDAGFDRMGVPAPAVFASRFPAFIGSAQAAPYQAVPTQVASAPARVRPALATRMAGRRPAVAVRTVPSRPAALYTPPRPTAPPRAAPVRATRTVTHGWGSGRAPAG